MPTARGWSVAVVAVVLLGLGATFGSMPVAQIGIALVVLLGLSIVMVRRSGVDLQVQRAISPQQVKCDQPVNVTLAIENAARRRAPLLLFEDRLPSDLTGRARFALAGIEAEGTRTATYEVRPPRRGRYVVGPLRIELMDPFSLARATTRGAGTSTFVVHPRIERLVLPRDMGEQRSLSISALKQPSGARGEDFYTLREYVEGDDLRRIHWRSTAKRGKYMIRQEETPWHVRATILLDLNAAAYDGYGSTSSNEKAVEAAASLVDLYHRSRYSYRLATSHGPGSDSSRGATHYTRCMDLLATAEQETHPDDQLLIRLSELEAGSTAEGTLIVVTGTLSPMGAVALGRCRRRYKSVIAVTLPKHRFGSVPTRERWEGETSTHDVMRLLSRSGVRSLSLGPADRLGPAWSSMTSSRSPISESSWDRKQEPV